MDTALRQTLRDHARQLRQDIIEMLFTAGSGHPAGALGLADIFSFLYFSGRVHYDAKRPRWADRDRVVVSNGHVCPVWYAALARAGFFPVAELKTLRRLGSRLQGHPSRLALPGIENTSGPLGQGLSQAVGMALAARLLEKKSRVFCVMSDAEHEEGQTWEAILSAASLKLGNLVAIIDRNRIQIDGYSEDIVPLGSLADRYRTAAWHVLEVDGHSFSALEDAFTRAFEVQDKPTVIVAQTVPGKGVSFMEHRPEWHGRKLTSAETKQALEEVQDND